MLFLGIFPLEVRLPPAPSMLTQRIGNSSMHSSAGACKCSQNPKLAKIKMIADRCLGGELFTMPEVRLEMTISDAVT